MKINNAKSLFALLDLPCMVLFVTSLGFIIFYGVLIFYYRYNWETLAEFEPAEVEPSSFISVIIPARNEEKNISHLLSALRNQSYPIHLFEIIVVDDFSTDGTADVIKNISLPNLIFTQPESEQGSSKKRAIESGIRIAKGNLIVTTDADCIPPVNWLKTLNSFYTTKRAAFIAAPVKLAHTHKWVEVFQALDFITLQGITAASVAADFHMMCNGANLAYTRQSFQSVNGFEGIDHVASGDDMLLMYKIRKHYPHNVFYLKSKAAIMSSEPMLTWKEFYMQRKRWASKTLVYDDYRIISVLIFVYIFNVLFFVLLTAAFFNNIYWWFVAAYLIIKTIIEWSFVRSVARFFGEQKLLKYFFIFQPFHIFYTVVIGLFSQFGNYEWKDRKTK